MISGLLLKEFDDFSIRWHYMAVLLYKAGDPESALDAIEKALISTYHAKSLV